MKTSDLCKRPAVTATTQATLADLSRLMRTHHVGSVVVVASATEDRPVGIVTWAWVRISKFLRPRTTGQTLAFGLAFE